MKNYDGIQKSFILILATLVFSAYISLPGLARTNAITVRQPPAQIATVTADSSKMTFQPSGNFSAVILTIGMPDGTVIRQEVVGIGSLSFSANDSNGQKRPDGQYKFELRAVPVFAPGVREALVAARQNGTEETVSRTMKQQGLIPPATA